MTISSTSTSTASRCALVAILALSMSPASHAGWWDKVVEAVDEKAKEQSSSTSTSHSSISTGDLSSAFKQALDVGSERVVQQLGQANGFNGDSAIRIPLPKNVKKMKSWLDKAGLGASLDDLEVQLNRAAENATPKARAIFVDTIKQMSFEDVRSIYSGGDDAATRYFQNKMSPLLTKEMQPVIQQSLSEVGAVKTYESAVSQYKSLPFVPDVKANLVGHVVDGSLDGIFHYLAKEEAAIRNNPVKRSTQLLQKVFGNK